MSIYGVSQYPGEQVEKDGHWHIHSDHKWQSSLHSRLRWNCFPSSARKPECFPPSASLFQPWDWGRILQSSSPDSRRVVKHADRRSMFKWSWSDPLLLLVHTAHRDSNIKQMSKWVNYQAKDKSMTHVRARRKDVFTNDVTTETQIHHREQNKKKKKRNIWW